MQSSRYKMFECLVLMCEWNFFKYTLFWVFVLKFRPSKLPSYFPYQTFQNEYTYTYMYIIHTYNSYYKLYPRELMYNNVHCTLYIVKCTYRWNNIYQYVKGVPRVGLRHQGWESATSRNGSDVRVGSVHWCDARNGSLPHHSYGFIIKKRILKMSITE